MSRPQGRQLRKPRPISPLVDPAIAVADEVIGWSEMDGKPITTDRIVNMIVTMMRLKQIKRRPPIMAVRLMVQRQATNRHVVVSPHVPDGTLPEVDPHDPTSWGLDPTPLDLD